MPMLAGTGFEVLPAAEGRIDLSGRVNCIPVTSTPRLRERSILVCVR
jgi:hypothetical protein